MGQAGRCRFIWKSWHHCFPIILSIQETDGEEVVEEATYGNRACSLFRILPLGTCFTWNNWGWEVHCQKFYQRVGPTELITLAKHGKMELCISDPDLLAAQLRLFGPRGDSHEASYLTSLNWSSYIKWGTKQSVPHTHSGERLRLYSLDGLKKHN